MIDLPLDIETKAFVLSFLGAFLGLFVARGLTLAVEWARRTRSPFRRHRTMNALRADGFGLPP